MKNNMTISLFLVSIFLLCACTMKPNRNETLYLLESQVEDICLSDFSVDISYVKLDLDAPINSIHNIHFTENFFFISTMPSKILKVSKNGKQVAKIGAEGRGPGEYLRSSNLTVDDENKRVFVFNHMSEILMYDYDGLFLKTIHVKEPSVYGLLNYFGDDTLLISRSNSDCYWMLIDLDGNPIQKRINYMKFDKTAMISINPGQIITQSGDSFFYYESFNDTIFKINRDDYEEYLVLFSDEYRMTKERFIKESPGWVNSVDLTISMPKYWNINDMLFSKKYIWFYYSFNYEHEMMLYDRNTGSKNYVKDFAELRGFKNDIDAGLPFFPKHCFVEHGSEYLITWCDAYELKAHVASEAFKNSTPKYPEKKRELEELANSLNNNDNPVLMLVKLKE